MADNPESNVRRRRLANELRRLREDGARKLEAVADQMEWSQSKLSRIETARVGVSPQDLRALLDLYNVHGDERDKLLRLGRDSRKHQPGWWQEYGDALTDQYTGYIELEANAGTISNYEPLCIPGLFQTEKYARALLRGALTMEPDELEHRLHARMTRQALLTRTDPPAPHVHAIVDEAALHRIIGSKPIMRAQLQRLLDLADLPNVALAVLPYTAGAYPGMVGPLVILDSPTTPAVVYLEGIRNAQYVEKPSDIGWFTDLFANLRTRALSPEKTATLIATTIKELS